MHQCSYPAVKPVSYDNDQPSKKCHGCNSGMDVIGVNRFLWDISITFQPQTSGTITERERERQKGCNNQRIGRAGTMTSGHDGAAVLMTSQQPWLRAQDPHKLKPVNTLPCGGKVFMNPPTPLIQELWTVDYFWGRIRFFKGMAPDRLTCSKR